MIDRPALWDLLHYLVGGDAGRRIDDPVVQAVVEGRLPADRYSCCADLPHALRYIYGLRNRVNRREAGSYLPGTRTMAWLCEPGRVGRAMGHPCATVPRTTAKLPLGATIILDVGNPMKTHTCVVIEQGADYLLTADYGQHPFTGQKPSDIACRVRRRALSVKGGKLWADARPIDSVLPLEAELAWAEKEGTRKPALGPNEWLERNGVKTANLDEGQAATPPKGAA